MKQEIRKLLVRIDESYDNLMGNALIPNIVDDYNSLLERLQEKYPNNSLIQSKLPINHQPFTFDDPRKKIEHTCKLIIDNLTDDTKTPINTINITIGSMHGNFSFENIINTIQQTNIRNKTEIINYVKEFKDELEKTNPDKSKLKKIIEKLQDIGVGVVAGLLVEAGKIFIGL